MKNHAMCVRAQRGKEQRDSFEEIGISGGSCKVAPVGIVTFGARRTALLDGPMTVEGVRTVGGRTDAEWRTVQESGQRGGGSFLRSDLFEIWEVSPYFIDQDDSSQLLSLPSVLSAIF